MYKKRVLDNGLTILGAPLKDSQTTTVMVLVGVGSRFETIEQNGLSHFLEHMMFKGTKKRPSAMAISTELDALGASYNAFTGNEYTGYYVKVRNPQKYVALDVISDIFQNSLLSEKDINVERGAIIEELNMYKDLPMRQVHNRFQNLLYGDTPLGRDIIGTAENILGFTPEQFRSYFTEKYVAENTLVVVAGEVDTSLMDKIEASFGNVRDTKAPAPEPVTEVQSAPQTLIETKVTDQTHLVYGFRTVPVTSDETYTAALAATILGGYMSSRLFREIRVNRGLAYYVRAGASSFRDAGYLAVSAGVRNDKAKEAIKLISKEFRTMKSLPVSEKELAIAKEYTKAKLVMNIESSDEVASSLALHQLQTGETLDIASELNHIEAVTRQDIQEFMKTYCTPERLNLALIGAFKQSEESQFLTHMKI